MAQTAAHLLTRRPDTERPVVPVMGELALQPGRVHELCGADRRTLAMMVAQKTDGAIFWILPGWQPDHISGQGAARFINPGRVTFIRAGNATDLLWTMEEVLRSGVVPLVVADLPAPPALTPIRRLHLSAERGAERGIAPLGLILTPGDGGSSGVETRWRLDPALPDAMTGAQKHRWRLSRLRARTLPPKSWGLRATQAGFCLIDLPESGADTPASDTATQPPLPATH
ncbi:ImuA family protein [Shimia ponticola]|uniref:ImuA family protein n=1 Tax=Shimia ponticola TaxID=2582893 RepID=UPI00164B0410|nr:hypothetical protein [Shimia ponticola]